MLEISEAIRIPLDDIEWRAVRATGPGGQNVNKTATAIHLRFDITRSTALPEDVKARLLARRDRRITADGVVVIKAQRFRTRERNRRDALERLQALLEAGLVAPETRKKTRPGPAVDARRLRDKAHRGRLKATRGPLRDDD